MLTRLETWRRIEKRERERGKEVYLKELEERPRLPHALRYLWDEYWQIKRGCEAVGVLEIDAYQRLTGSAFDAFEFDALLEIDLKRRERGH